MDLVVSNKTYSFFLDGPTLTKVYLWLVNNLRADVIPYESFYLDRKSVHWLINHLKKILPANKQWVIDEFSTVKNTLDAYEKVKFYFFY